MSMSDGGLHLFVTDLIQLQLQSTMLKNGGTHLRALKKPAMHQIINRLA